MIAIDHLPKRCSSYRLKISRTATTPTRRSCRKKWRPCDARRAPLDASPGIGFVGVSWGFQLVMGVPPIAGWFLWKSHLELMICGYPHFRKPPNLHRKTCTFSIIFPWNLGGSTVNVPLKLNHPSEWWFLRKSLWKMDDDWNLFPFSATQWGWISPFSAHFQPHRATYFRVRYRP